MSMRAILRKDAEAVVMGTIASSHEPDFFGPVSNRLTFR
jgi:hypothetical protein